MLRFFRNIRRRLLDSGKVQNYLLYAVGEILLVMIGILLALQVNNWNEKHKIYEKQKGYLLLIKNEMVNNLEALLREKQTLMSTIHAQEKIINLMYKDTNDIPEKELSALMGQSFSQDIEFPYENGALTELKSSGSLKDIANDSIRAMLASWEGKIDWVRLQEKSLYDYWVKCNDYLEIHGDFGTIVFGTEESANGNSDKILNRPGNKSILQSREFGNKLLLYSMTGQGLRNIRYVALEKDIRKLIKMIDRELGIKETIHFYDENIVFWDGRLNPNLSYRSVTSGGAPNWASVESAELCMSYPAQQEWGILDITMGTPSNPPRPSADFSKYKKLVIELKGAQGGERVQIAMKDKDDPDDGSEAKFPITLTNDWKTYEIDIANNFASADVKNLYVIASIEFGGAAPQNVCVRKIYFK
ncbi:MAG: hypothetical protein IPJ74_14290 [Saprospiraceae bacterium]|nr:hypothetical protein [Saprospiraceae bacterium]